MSEATEKIDTYIRGLPAWKQDNLNSFRTAIYKVAPETTEAWKWSCPVFLVNGKMIGAMSTFTAHTKYNFFHGAALRDEHGLFNSGLDSKQHRSINLKEGEAVHWNHMEDLLREAVAYAAAH